MPRNIEIKAKIHDRDHAAALIQVIADGPPEYLEQDDTFFACDAGRLKLRVCGSQAQLIFYQRPDQTGPVQSFYLISETSEPDTLRDVLGHAYSVTGRVRKQRALYFRGRTRIHLDAVEGLGDFLELEVVLGRGEPGEQGMAEANDILKLLDVSECQLIEAAYFDLIADKQTNDPCKSGSGSPG